MRPKRNGPRGSLLRDLGVRLELLQEFDTAWSAPGEDSPPSFDAAGGRTSWRWEDEPSGEHFDGGLGSSTAWPRGAAYRPDFEGFGPASPPVSRVLDGRYRLTQVIARGGMGQVFRGVDLGTNEEVAIKVVPGDCAEVARHSVEIARVLDHPGVQSIKQVGRLEGGGIYLVLPLFNGQTLAQLFRVCRSSEALLLAIRRVCEGVAHAHSRGIIHRDLKPSNILVERDGRAVVLDWELACRPQEQESCATTPIMGTPRYMAPEQVEGRRLSAATDVYALGMVLYEGLTGRHPARDLHTFDALFRWIVHENPPPPSSLEPTISQELDQLVLRCLLKDPAGRYRNASELLEALEELETSARETP